LTERFSYVTAMRDPNFIIELAAASAAMAGGGLVLYRLRRGTGSVSTLFIGCLFSWQAMTRP
jgi:hypothetical protein